MILNRDNLISRGLSGMYSTDIKASKATDTITKTTDTGTKAADTSQASRNDARWQRLSRFDLGSEVPRRAGVMTPILASGFLKVLGWEIVGSIPNVPKAVYLALPHTSNFDALYTIPTLLALDLDIKIMGKQGLFKNPILRSFLKWAGIIPINRGKKGSVLQASIERFKTSNKLHLGLSPEGTRDYTKEWKTGFYYIAQGANVPIVPVAMDYNTKQVRFMRPVKTTDDIEADFLKIIEQYKGVVPKHPKRLSQPLQDINKA